MSERKNYYQVLEIEPTATPQAIEHAYIRARNAYSGDSVALYSLMTKEECDSILNQIEDAYAVIGFPERRREYDRSTGFNQTNKDSRVPNYTEPKASENVQYEDFSSNLIEAKVSKINAQKRFGLEFSENTDMERTIRECTDFTGEFLQKVREYKNVTVERMADMTKVSKTFIRAIEADDVSKLPADVYTRGYVYQYAKVLKLNPDQVATSYLFHFRKLKNQK